MNKLLKRTTQLLFTRQTSIVSSTIILAVMTITARLFGFIRYSVYTEYFDPKQLDLFITAFKIPDLIFEILVTGALSSTLIPFFIKYQKDHDSLNRNISSVANMIIIALSILILILYILMPFMMFLIAPGFVHQTEKINQIISFSQILLFGQLPFLVLGNLLTGISQAKKRFMLPAVAPVVYNILIITLTLTLGNRLGLLAPVLGVVAGAILFFITQLPTLYFAQFEYKLVIQNAKTVMSFFKMAIPRIFTVIIAQIDATMDLALSTLINLEGSVTYFYFAQALQLLPVSIIGISFGQASLPYLSEMYQEGKTEDFKKIIITSILNLFFLIIPFAALFIFARTPMVRFFFGRSKFDWIATEQTALALSYFALSIPFHSIYYFITRCYYAMFDTKTPFYVAGFQLALNATLSATFVLVLHLQVWSLALAFSISMTSSVLILFFILNKKLHGLDLHTLFTELTKICLATAIASITAHEFIKIMDGLIFDTSRTINVFLLLGSTSIFYFLLYLFLAWTFNIKEIYVLSSMFLKVKEYHKKIFEVYKGTE